MYPSRTRAALSVSKTSNIERGTRAVALRCSLRNDPARVLVTVAAQTRAAGVVSAKSLELEGRSWVEASYPNVVYFNEVDKGGHFAAWEEPELFSSELRAAFSSLR